MVFRKRNRFLGIFNTDFREFLTFGFLMVPTVGKFGWKLLPIQNEDWRRLPSWFLGIFNTDFREGWGWGVRARPRHTLGFHRCWIGWFESPKKKFKKWVQMDLVEHCGVFNYRISGWRDDSGHRWRWYCVGDSFIVGRRRTRRNLFDVGLLLEEADCWRRKIVIQLCGFNSGRLLPPFWKHFHVRLPAARGDTR